MSLKEKIKQDLILALKAKKMPEVLTLRQVLAAVLNKEKEKKYQLKEKQDTELTSEEVAEVISSEAKKRKESILGFEKGKRKDLVEKEKKELEILENYLPEQLSKEEIGKLAKLAIEKIGAREIKDMGRVMAELMPRVKGKADGKLVSEIIKELLN